jgi:type I restriction enzyme R subunit
LGINPKIPPVELLSDDFHREGAQKHSGGDPEAKASEMEHAIRKHCTIHFDEDPAFYKKLSEKLEKLIQEHQDNWKVLAVEYEKLRQEKPPLGAESHTKACRKRQRRFMITSLQMAFAGGEITEEDRQALKGLMSRVVEMLQDTIGIIDFWKKPIEVKKLRGNIDTEILFTGIPSLAKNHERIAVEIVKLAEKRNNELIK